MMNVLLLATTVKKREAQKIEELLSHKVPEILAIPIAEGNQPYLEWLNATLSNSGEQ